METGSIKGFEKHEGVPTENCKLGKGEKKWEFVVSFHFVHSVSHSHLTNSDVMFYFTSKVIPDNTPISAFYLLLGKMQLF